MEEKWETSVTENSRHTSNTASSTTLFGSVVDHTQPQYCPFKNFT